MFLIAEYRNNDYRDFILLEKVLEKGQEKGQEKGLEKRQVKWKLHEIPGKVTQAEFLGDKNYARFFADSTLKNEAFLVNLNNPSKVDSAYDLSLIHI